MSKQLNEDLEYMDMKGLVIPRLDIDKYDSAIDTNDEMITLTFATKAQAVADDLTSWLERGYEWVVDADRSPAEVERRRYLVFVEMDRRRRAPEHIVEMLADMETLTGLKVEEWKIVVDDKEYPATEESIRQHVITSPKQYREQKEEGLNELREMAGLETVAIYTDRPDDIKQIQQQAGLI